MNSSEVREMSPYKMLLLAVLLVVVLAQSAAMAMLARSQVQKAQQREAEERSQRTAASVPSEAPPVVATRRAPSGSITNVGYRVSR